MVLRKWAEGGRLSLSRSPSKSRMNPFCATQKNPLRPSWANRGFHTTEAALNEATTYGHCEASQGASASVPQLGNGAGGGEPIEKR